MIVLKEDSMDDLIQSVHSEYFYKVVEFRFTTFRNQQVVKEPISAKAGQNLWLLPFPPGNQAFLGL